MRLVVAACALLAGCTLDLGRLRGMPADAGMTDAPRTDAPGLDAPGTDSPGTDAPGLDAPEPLGSITEVARIGATDLGAVAAGRSGGVGLVAATSSGTGTMVVWNVAGGPCGARTLREVTNLPVSAAGAIALGDLDGDDILEGFVITPANLHVYGGAMSGSDAVFAGSLNLVSLSPFTAPVDVAVGDWAASDGYLDAAAFDYDGRVLPLRGDGTRGLIGSSVIMGSSGTLVLGGALVDENADGSADLIFLSRSGATSNVVVERSSGTGFLGPTTYAAGTALRLDAATGDAGTLIVAAGATSATFVEPTSATATTIDGIGTSNVDVAVGDLDGDGWPDVVVADEAGLVLRVLAWPMGASVPVSLVDLPIDEAPEAVEIADLDGDALEEIVVATASSVRIFASSCP